MSTVKYQVLPNSMIPYNEEYSDTITPVMNLKDFEDNRIKPLYTISADLQSQMRNVRKNGNIKLHMISNF